MFSCIDIHVLYVIER